MNHPDDDTGAHEAPPNGGPVTVAMGMVALIAGFHLLREHWGDVSGLWTYLLLLACPLLHLLHGHGGHGRHGTPGGRGHDHGARGG